MSTKLDEIRQRHANGYKGLEAERAFPDVAWLLAQNDRLRKPELGLNDQPLPTEHELVEQDRWLDKNWPHPTYIELEDQVKRLRAALEKIARTEGNVHPSWHVRIAREALDRDNCG